MGVGFGLQASSLICAVRCKMLVAGGEIAQKQKGASTEIAKGNDVARTSK